MMRFLPRIVLLATVALIGMFGRNAAVASATSVTFEAEAGVLGADLTNGVSSGVQLISTSTDRINDGNPGSSDRMATYTVTFPAAGG